ncbi:MAG: hypothetical protein N838_09600 [Thiohalocapsa sp. PB-PSB1]|nr:MAG: hypothetical protein N838_09600 [Thiohalocapsa sp. PB-PSB1]
MSATRIRYRVVGQDDYMLNIDVEPDGHFAIDYGDYTSHKPAQGIIDKTHGERLTAALQALGDSAEYPAPDGATGFMAELTVGEGQTMRHFRFWEGALQQQPELQAVVRALEVLG